jgi:hypothetical protein
MLFFFGTFGGLRDFKHDPDLAIALGNMVAVWSNAEQALVNLLHKMGQLPYSMASSAYYKIPTFEARTKVLRGMLCEWDTEQFDVKAIDRGILKLNALARTRNKYVHWTYLVMNGTGETWICNYRRPSGDPDRMEKLTASSVLNHVAAVERRAVTLWTLTGRT